MPKFWLILSYNKNFGQHTISYADILVPYYIEMNFFIEWDEKHALFKFINYAFHILNVRLHRMQKRFFQNIAAAKF